MNTAIVVTDNGLVLEFSLDPSDSCNGYYGLCGGCDGCCLMQAEHAGHLIVYPADAEYNRYRHKPEQPIDWREAGF